MKYERFTVKYTLQYYFCQPFKDDTSVFKDYIYSGIYYCTWKQFLTLTRSESNSHEIWVIYSEVYSVILLLLAIQRLQICFTLFKHSIYSTQNTFPELFLKVIAMKYENLIVKYTSTPLHSLCFPLKINIFFLLNALSGKFTGTKMPVLAFWTLYLYFNIIISILNLQVFDMM